jgi:antitoxin component YwqK of YwqJK toxin-antitoxin module
MVRRQTAATHTETADDGRTTAHEADGTRGLVAAVDSYPNGNPRYRGANLDGQMHGPWTFYRADGSVMRTGTFDRGRQIGVWRTFTRDGTLAKETDFGG